MRRIIAPLLVLTIVLYGFVDATMAKVDEVEMLLNNSMYNEALQLLTKLAEQEPYKYDYPHLIGKTYTLMIINQGDSFEPNQLRSYYSQAVESFRDAIDLANLAGASPAIIRDISLDAVILHLWFRNFEQARRELIPILRLMPNDPLTIYWMGETYLYEWFASNDANTDHLADEAVKYFETAIKANEARTQRVLIPGAYLYAGMYRLDEGDFSTGEMYIVTSINQYYELSLQKELTPLENARYETAWQVYDYIQAIKTNQ